MSDATKGAILIIGSLAFIGVVVIGVLYFVL